MSNLRNPAVSLTRRETSKCERKGRRKKKNTTNDGKKKQSMALRRERIVCEQTRWKFHLKRISDRIW